MFNKFWQFVKDVKVEFSKVSWPSREELIQSTLVVIVVSMLVAIFVGIVDLGLSKLITLLLG